MVHKTQVIREDLQSVLILDINVLCLYCFLYQDTSNGPYPVMFWIHGGGWTGSGNVQYPGYFLAARDVVVVVINYRLGHLGESTLNQL